MFEKKTNYLMQGKYDSQISLINRIWTNINCCMLLLLIVFTSNHNLPLIICETIKILNNLAQILFPYNYKLKRQHLKLN